MAIVEDKWVFYQDVRGNIREASCNGHPIRACTIDVSYQPNTRGAKISIDSRDFRVADYIDPANRVTERANYLGEYRISRDGVQVSIKNPSLELLTAIDKAIMNGDEIDIIPRLKPEDRA